MVVFGTSENFEEGTQIPMLSGRFFNGTEVQFRSNVVVIGNTVYIQDMRSNVFALDRDTGAQKWEAPFDIGSIGPNGVAVAYGMVYAGLSACVLAEAGASVASAQPAEAEASLAPPAPPPPSARDTCARPVR